MVFAIRNVEIVRPDGIGAQNESQQDDISKGLERMDELHELDIGFLREV
jgi:hypothetical protein